MFEFVMPLSFRHLYLHFWIVLFLLLPFQAMGQTIDDPQNIRIYPAPAGADMYGGFNVSVGGTTVPVYTARVAPADDYLRMKAMDDTANSGRYFEKAGFCIFDMNGPVTVTVETWYNINSVKILPVSLGVKPQIGSRKVTFQVDKPANLTVEFNGNTCNSLHVFANPFETDIPKTDDPNVVYFGPGMHELSESLNLKDGQTLYLAGGAVVRSAAPEGSPMFGLYGKKVAMRGRGIVDMLGTPAKRRTVQVRGASDVVVEGVVLINNARWTVALNNSQNVSVRSVKIIGQKNNTDGIDISNCNGVLVDGCFIRTLDDLVCVKSIEGDMTKDITVRNCVLWNSVAHALSVGAETRQDIDNVLFSNCDIIHDIGREWTMRIFHGDGSLISNVRFENIRVEDATDRLISVWIGKTAWSASSERGRIKNVVFKNIQAKTLSRYRVELRGADADHVIENVQFQNIVVNGKPLTTWDVVSNSYIKDVVVQP